MATTTSRPAYPWQSRNDEDPPWKDRLLPRTVLGLAVVLLAASIGAAFSGTVLYAYYEYRLNQNEERISSFVAGFDERFETALKTIDAEREQAKADVRAELQPLQELQAGGETLKELVRKVQGAVWFVSTLDEAGQPSVGSAFVVASDGGQSLLLTSYNTVRAATRSPAPGIIVRKGDDQLRVTLWTWQEEKDLALLVASRGSLPKLPFAPRSPALETGSRVFAMSGLGGQGGAISQGFVADVSGVGIQHTAPIGSAFQGGPLLNSKGEVLGIASRSYAPLGFQTEEVWFAVPIPGACERVLRCPDGVVGAGNRR